LPKIRTSKGVTKMDQMIYEIKIFSLFPFQFFQNYQSPDQGHHQSV
jgi:hypothetical protein